ncbi:MAG: DPP IV N-terminal domain-containing protein, partial [Chitinophagaceae bacterium]|nr:DPP IV N-terminal domain-containing protein [Chitinophagaceae bacterium]
MKKILLVFISCIALGTGFSQQQKFTTDQLVKNQLPADFRNNLPVVVKWLDEDNVMLRMALAPDSIVSTYVLDIPAGKFTKATKEQLAGTLPPNKSVSVRAGKLYYRENGKEKQITFDAGEVKTPSFSPDSQYIAYTKANDLYTFHMPGGKENRLTTDGSFTTLNGFASW